MTGSPHSSIVRSLLKQFDELLTDPEITELAINRAGEFWYEHRSEWHQVLDEGITLEWFGQLAPAVATFGKDNINDAKPILSTALPNGHRIQIVMPPACSPRTYSITIRKPSDVRIPYQKYADQGYFQHINAEASSSTKPYDALLELYKNGDFQAFIPEAIKQNLNIVVAGETGSGKTTFMKSLVDLIPSHERLITIEDTHELQLPNHPNHVHLLYPSEAKGEGSIVTATSLLKSTLRMKPNRIILAELRGRETYDFVNIAASGHGGSITSVHAGSCELAYERMAMMLMQSPDSKALPYDVIKHVLEKVVDVVIHITNDVGGKGRHITGVHYQRAKNNEYQS